MKKVFYFLLSAYATLGFYNTHATVFTPGADVDPDTIPQIMPKVPEKAGSMQYTSIEDTNIRKKHIKPAVASRDSTTLSPQERYQRKMEQLKKKRTKKTPQRAQ